VVFLRLSSPHPRLDWFQKAVMLTSVLDALGPFAALRLGVVELHRTAESRLREQ
jgi:hypothetical protein